MNGKLAAAKEEANQFALRWRAAESLSLVAQFEGSFRARSRTSRAHFEPPTGERAPSSLLLPSPVAVRSLARAAGGRADKAPSLRPIGAVRSVPAAAAKASAREEFRSAASSRLPVSSAAPVSSLFAAKLSLDGRAASFELPAGGPNESRSGESRAPLSSLAR